ncbi:MAG TPA: methyltransferase domain-containing protein [Chthoniobacterales bacterium]|nr:methyltransferase domain-containing protein [Chthoniobacterales bacterium]
MKRIQPQPEWPQSWKESHFYDRSEIYGEISHYGYAYAYDNRRKATLQLLTEVLSPGARVLDVAAAQGNFSLALAELGFDVTWNDLRAELADYVRLKYERGKIAYAAGNAFELNFPSLFEAVLITEVIEHVAHPDEFLAKAAALVRPGGYIVMTTPNGGYFRNRLPKFSECADPSVFESVQFKPNADGHIFLLHVDEIEPLAQRAGLTVEKIVLFTNSLTAGHVKTESHLKILPPGIVRVAERFTELLPHALKKKALVQIGVRFRKVT